MRDKEMWDNGESTGRDKYNLGTFRVSCGNVV